MSNISTATKNMPFRNEVTVHAFLDTINDKDSVPITAINNGNGTYSLLVNIGSVSLVEPISVTSASDFFLDIARGNVSNMSVVHKFGDNADIDTAEEDIWSFGGTYTFSTSADIDTLSSSDPGDSQVIEIQGLDGNWDLITQNATLDGQNKVTLTTSLLRAFRMKNEGASDLAGNVHLYPDTAITAGVPDDAATNRAYIASGDSNQTLMAIYTIPNNKTGYMQSWYASLSRAQAAVAKVRIVRREENGVFQDKEVVTVNSNGTSKLERIYITPQQILQHTDIVIRSDASTNNVGVSAGFDIVLVDN